MAKRKGKNAPSTTRVKITRIVDTDVDVSVRPAAGPSTASPYDHTTTISTATRVLNYSDRRSGALGVRTSYVEDVVRTTAIEGASVADDIDRDRDTFHNVDFDDLPEQTENHESEQQQHREENIRASKRRRVSSRTIGICSLVLTIPSR